MVTTPSPPGAPVARRSLTLPPAIAPLGLAALAVLYLAPALQTGYWAEDVLYSMARGDLRFEGIGLGERAVQRLVEVIGLGRFAPLNPLLQIVVHALAPDVWWYKAWTVALAAVDLLLFHTLVGRLSGQAGLATLAGLMAVGLWQFRLASDALLGYHGQMQVVTAILLGALLALHAFLCDGRRRWLVLSVLLVLTNALIYEVTYPLVALPLLLIAHDRQSWRTRLALGTPYVAVVAACGVAALLVRRWNPSTFYIHRTNFAPGYLAENVARQVAACLPWSYLRHDPHEVIAKSTSPAALWLGLLRGQALGVVLLTAGLCGLALWRRPGAGPEAPGRPWGPRGLVTLGGLLAVLPALLVAPSEFHRNSSPPGVGWVQIYIQSFGGALVLAALAWAALGRWARHPGPAVPARCAALTLAVVLLVGLTDRANQIVAVTYNAPPDSRFFAPIAADHIAVWHYHRLNLETALQAGLADPVPDGAAVVLVHEYPAWFSGYHAQPFFAMHAGRRIVALPPDPAERMAWTRTTPTTPSRPIAGSDPEPPTYRLRDLCAGRGIGFVALARTLPPASGGSPPPPEPIRLFVRDPGLGRPGGAGRMRVLAEGPIPLDRAVAELERIAAGPDWVLLALDPTLDPDSVRVEFATPTPAVAAGPGAPTRPGQSASLSPDPSGGAVR